MIALSSGSFAGCLPRVFYKDSALSSPRVIALAVVRDRFGGREMARVMSFVMMVFIVVPILAPGVGEIILQLSDWRIIFDFLLLVAASSIVWAWFRLPEKRHELGALSMEPMSHIAGTASSLAGFYSTAAGAAFGTAIGRSFDGAVRRLCIGITLLFIATLVTVLLTERFKLNQHKSAPDVPLPHSESAQC
jgi:DHA1 family bicyclomycin/chloramphenicol resistance-like MFS transporter